MQSVLIGNKYHKWTVLESVPKKKNNSYFLCKCDCGTIKEVSGSNLIKNKTKSCGCNWSTWIPANKLPDGQAAFNTLFSAYKRRAKVKNRDFHLTEKEFKTLIFQNCYYCGIKPSTLTRSNYRDKDTILNNGIDRIDSSQGYILNNCVTCCKDCNYLKNDLSSDQFFQKIKLIYELHLKEI